MVMFVSAHRADVSMDCEGSRTPRTEIDGEVQEE